jgi:hypothetical protein
MHACYRFLTQFNIWSNCCLTLVREAAGFSEVLVTTHQTKWCHNPEDDSPNFCHENFNSHLTVFFFEPDGILLCLGTVLDEMVVIHCKCPIWLCYVVLFKLPVFNLYWVFMMFGLQWWSRYSCCLQFCLVSVQYQFCMIMLTLSLFCLIF